MDEWGGVRMCVYVQLAGAGRRFSRGIVPSWRTLLTAACPHVRAIAAPGRRAGGEVMFPWAETVEMARSTAMAVDRRELPISLVLLFLTVESEL